MKISFNKILMGYSTSFKLTKSRHENMQHHTESINFVLFEPQYLWSTSSKAAFTLILILYIDLYINL